MKNLSLFLAWRYLAGTRKEKNISTMVKICFLGIFIGTFALSLAVAIMNGFEIVTHEKIQGIHSQIIIRSPGNFLDYEAFKQLFAQHFPEIQAYAPSDVQQIMLQNPITEQVDHVMAIKGIEPEHEARVNTIQSKITAAQGNEKTLQTIVHDNHILIGSKIAGSLNLKPGDTINLLFAPHEHKGRKITLDSVPAIVGGLYDTGIEDIDANIIFASLDFLLHIFPESSITQIELKLYPYTDEQTIITKLQQRLPSLEIYSWKELYKPLVAALKLEKYVAFLILALITLVASMNIISMLFMQITQKRGDIAILQAMGCNVKILRNTFVIMGLFVAGIACLLGLVVSAGACYILETYPFITLPDVYYATHLPAKIDPWLWLIIYIVVMSLTGIATWIPAQRAWQIKVADVLRFDT